MSGCPVFLHIHEYQTCAPASMLWFCTKLWSSRMLGKTLPSWCEWRSYPCSFCIQSHILLRSEISRSGGSPPADVTPRIRRGPRAGCPLTCINSRRKARWIMSRNVVPLSSSFRLAASRTSSGSSTVILIQFPMFPYLWAIEFKGKPRTYKIGPRYPA